MADLASFRNSISLELGLSNVDGSDEQALIDQRVNEGVTDVLLRTGCKVIPATMAEDPNDGDYTLDTAILRVKGWSFANSSGTVTPERVTVEEILRSRAASGSVASASPASKYAIAGSNLLMVWPTPTSADTVTVYYVPRPVALSTANASPDEIPAEFHPAVEAYAKWRLASYDDDQSSAQGQRYKEEYDQWIRDIRRFVTVKGGKPARATVNPGRRRVVNANNSVY